MMCSHMMCYERYYLVLLSLLLQSTLVLLSGDCNSYEREKVNEGYYQCIHMDPILDTFSLGVGFNIYDYAASEELKKVGANYTNIVNGKECLTDKQIMDLFNVDMSKAVECASEWMGKLWSSLSLNPQSALADMAFDYNYIGCYPKLYDFVDLKNALSMTPPNYDGAVSILQRSTWCGQENERCMQAIKCFQLN